MGKKLSFAVSLLLVQLFLYSSVASAHHFIWVAHDSRFQTSDFAGNETYLNWWMINGAVTVTTSDSTISTNVTSAINNWNTAIPEVRISGSGSDLSFVYSDSNCLAGSGGCYDIIQVYNDTTRGANYVMKARITITSDSPSRTRTAAHEIGHYIGLHEQYRDDGSTGTFCNSVSTIMNGGGCDTLTGPTSNDVFRVDNYLGHGWAENLSSSMLTTSVARFTFKDRAFGELHYRVQLQKRSTSGTSWSTVSTQQVTSNTGLVKGLSWTADRTITADFSLGSFGSGTYRVAVAPYFKSYDVHGTVEYSPQVYY